MKSKVKHRIKQVGFAAKTLFGATQRLKYLRDAKFERTGNYVKTSTLKAAAIQLRRVKAGERRVKKATSALQSLEVSLKNAKDTAHTNRFERGMSPGAEKREQAEAEIEHLQERSLPAAQEKLERAQARLETLKKKFDGEMYDVKLTGGQRARANLAYVPYLVAQSIEVLMKKELKVPNFASASSRAARRADQ